MTNYQAAIFHQDGSVHVESVPRRTLAFYEVRLQVIMAGICSTDLALQRRLLPTRIPRTFGHEFVGKVIEVGEATDREWLGRRVCADINFGCIDQPTGQFCSICQATDRHHCSRRTVLGIDDADGAFATETIVPAANLLSVPESVSDQQAVFVEPLAAAIHTFTGLSVEPRTVIVVLGTGRLGALIACVGQRLGGQVISVTRSRNRHDLLHAIGLQLLCSRDRDDVEHAVREMTCGPLADIVVESTGTPEGLNQALQLVRPQGHIVLKSTCGLPANFDQTRVVVDEIRLTGSRCGDYSQALQWLTAASVPVDSLVTKIFPLRAIGTAMTAAQHDMKVLLKMNNEEP